MVIDKEALDFKSHPGGVNCGKEELWALRTLCERNLDTQDLLGPEPFRSALKTWKEGPEL